MIREVTDAAILNAFSAHPDISAKFGGAIEFSGAMRETAVYLFGEHGGLAFEWTAPRTYEVHIMLTTAGRGRWGIEAVKRALAIMMAERGANHVWARVKPDDRHISLFARWCGFQPVGEQVLYSPERELWHLLEWRR
jgi:RimJ/RimL family protein N-acetyltransferase